MKGLPLRIFKGFFGRNVGLHGLVKLAGNVLTEDASEYSIYDLGAPPFSIFAVSSSLSVSHMPALSVCVLYHVISCALTSPPPA